MIKIQGILPNGKMSYEINFRLKEYESGIWYPCEYEKTRPGNSNPDGSPIIEKRMKIKAIKFNIDVNDDMFKLEFPPGTRVKVRIQELASEENGLGSFDCTLSAPDLIAEGRIAVYGGGRNPH